MILDTKYNDALETLLEKIDGYDITWLEVHEAKLLLQELIKEAHNDWKTNSNGISRSI